MSGGREPWGAGPGLGPTPIGIGAQWRTPLGRESERVVVFTRDVE